MKGLWSPDEDERLRRSIKEHPDATWSQIARQAGLQRCGKSCRRRWTNHLRPHLKRGKFSTEEIRLVKELREVLGNRWSAIAAHLEGRTDNDVKNLWYSLIKKKAAESKKHVETDTPDKAPGRQSVRESGVPATSHVKLEESGFCNVDELIVPFHVEQRELKKLISAPLDIQGASQNFGECPYDQPSPSLYQSFDSTAMTTSADSTPCNSSPAQAFMLEKLGLESSYCQTLMSRLSVTEIQRWEIENKPMHHQSLESGYGTEDRFWLEILCRLDRRDQITSSHELLEHF